MSSSSKTVEVKTRVSPQLRRRFAKVAESNGRSVSRELERLMLEHVDEAEDLERRRQAALERLAGV